MLNYSIILEDTARRRPDHPAFKFMDKTLSYAQTNAAANQVANGLVAAGIKPGDKVAVSCLSLPYFPMIVFGILKAGAVLVPLNVLLKPQEIAYHLQDCDAKAFFCFEGNEVLPMGGWGHEAFEATPSCEHFFMVTADPAAASPIDGGKTLGGLMAGQAPTFDPVQTAADDTAVIIYTSGTTGNPKGAELTNANVMMNTVLLRDLMQYTDEDVSILVLPLFHVFGLIVQMASGIYHGVTHVLVPKFEPGPVMELLDRENVSVFCGVPTMYWALLNTETDADLGNISKHLRCCISAGQSIPGPTLEAFEKKFNTSIIEGYGMSETSPGITFNRLDMPRKVGSVGTPFWGVEVRIVDPDGNDVATGERGEVICRGHNVMKGYFGAPEKTADAIRNGWMHTGDVGKFDEDGYLYIIDRIKEMINRGGENIYPTEVEGMLTEHEAISLVAVIPTPDERMGEEIKACVVLAEGASATEDDIITWAKGRMAAQKYPRKVEIMEALPMTATGKILKKELKAREAG